LTIATTQRIPTAIALGGLNKLQPMATNWSGKYGHILALLPWQWEMLLLPISPALNGQIRNKISNFVFSIATP
jgi:hypothetical protein